MMKSQVASLVCVCVIVTLLLILPLSGLPPTTAQAPAAAAPATFDPTAAVIFIENAGQFADDACYQVRGAPQGTIWLAEDAIWLTVIESPTAHGAHLEPDAERADPRLSDESRQAAAIKLSFPGANPHPRLEPFHRLETLISFFNSNEPEAWQADVPAWSGVRYADLYPGIDLELTGGSGQILPRLVARPGADVGAVRLRLEGAEAVTVEGDTLRLSTAIGDATWPLLRAEGWTAEPVVRPRGTLAFDVATPFRLVTQDPSLSISRPLSSADDPADLLYGTFLGGSDSDRGSGIALDETGAAYITGSTYSFGFPATPGAFDTGYNAAGDVVVVKLSPDGSALTYASFLGGSDWEFGSAITVDESGAAYVTGSTQSSDFPATPGAFDTSYNGYMDTFVVKVGPDGSTLEYATYLGGSSTWWDVGADIAVDGSGAAYILGYTGSWDFPTTPGAFDPTPNGGDDAFVAKLNAAGSALVYSTFLGGSGFDTGSRIAANSSGAACVTGYTESSDFPTTPGAFDTSQNGSGDAFVVRLNAAGSALDYATFLGGSDDDRGEDIAVDGSGVAYVTGSTLSSDFPTTPGAFDRSYNGGGEYGGDAFVAKLDAAGSDLVYATFLGGSDDDYGGGIAVDGSGAAYVTDSTLSSDFPTTPGAFDRSYNGGGEYGGDAFVAKLAMLPLILDHSVYLPLVLRNH
jgi:hypothetical protein